MAGYIASYSKWRSVFEGTGQAEVISSNIISVLDNHKIDIKTLKEKLDRLKAQEISLSDDPIIPANVPFDQYSDIVEKKVNESLSDWEYLIDIAIDVIAGILDGIPLGITQVASTVVDLLHTMSYALRWWFSSDENSKIKYLVMTFLGIASSFIPLGGNVMNISGLNRVSSLLKVSPHKITKAAYAMRGKNLAMSHWSYLAKWKVNFLYVLLKIIGNFGQDLLQKISTAFSKMFEGLVKYLKAWVQTSPLTGWIVSDYILPMINKVRITVNDLKNVTGLNELVAVG